MTKKMAVRNKKNKSDKTGIFKSTASLLLTSRLPKLIFRWSLLVFSAGIIWIAGSNLNNSWIDIWPVENISVTDSVKHIEQRDLINLLTKLEMKGMLSIDLDVLHKELLKNSWVKRATIRKQWPGTIIFEIEERQPIAVINNKLLLENGQFVINKNDIDSGGLIRIVIDDLKNQSDLTMLDFVKQANNIKNELSQLQLELSEIKIDKMNGWSVAIDGKFSINLGRKNKFSKIQKFFKVFAAIEKKERISAVDLRYKNGLAVKYKSRTAEDINKPS